MINLKLQKEILSHIAQMLGFGLFPDRLTSAFLQSLNNPQFLVEKKIYFSSDDKEYQKNLWAGFVKIEEEGEIKLLVADLTQDNIPEYAIIIQLDNFPPYGLRISADPEDIGTIVFQIENRWVDISAMFQSKLLVAMESLSETMLMWEPLKDYYTIYQLLLSFLKFDGGEES